LDPYRAIYGSQESAFPAAIRSLKVRSLQVLKVCVLALASVSVLAASGKSAELLTIGSKAPALDIEHWVQNGNGKFKPVTQFQPGKVYVVEFWATWCGPCIQSMPHLASLQTEYADKGVQLISISDEDLETVEKFLDREVRGAKKDDSDAKPQTYRDVTSAYCLTTDPDQSSSRDYMEAAQQNGIPTAFIVGKDSKIEWIGHPMEMDGPLKAIVSDTWDRDAFLKELKDKQEAEKAMQDVFKLVQQQKFDQAVGAIDTLLEKRDDLQLKMMKLQVLLLGKKTAEANTFVQTLYKDLADKPEIINMITWNLYEMAAQGRLKSDEMVNSAIKAAEQAIAKSEKGEKATIMDTLAHLLTLKGEDEKALKIEEEALKIANETDKAFMKQFIDELRANKEGKAAEPAPKK
jgi:thiol-disulfide isomerase/thioredoxin